MIAERLASQAGTVLSFIPVFEYSESEVTSIISSNEGQKNNLILGSRKRFHYYILR